MHLYILVSISNASLGYKQLSKIRMAYFLCIILTNKT